MSVITRYTFVGDTTVEIATTVADGDTSTDVNVLLPTSVLGTPVALEVSVADGDTAESTEAITVEEPLVAQPLWGTFEGTAQAPSVVTPLPTKKLRGLQALIRGMYTVLFSLLGMLAAGATALRDNLSQLTDLKWTTILIVVGGAVLAGVAYGLKRWFKPDGLL